MYRTEYNGTHTIKCVIFLIITIANIGNVLLTVRIKKNFNYDVLKLLLLSSLTDMKSSVLEMVKGK
jgi:hypothetical protein